MFIFIFTSVPNVRNENIKLKLFSKCFQPETDRKHIKITFCSEFSFLILGTEGEKKKRNAFSARFSFLFVHCFKYQKHKFKTKNNFNCFQSETDQKYFENNLCLKFSFLILSKQAENKRRNALTIKYSFLFVICSHSETNIENAESAEFENKFESFVLPFSACFLYLFTIIVCFVKTRFYKKFTP